MIGVCLIYIATTNQYMMQLLFNTSLIFNDQSIFLVFKRAKVNISSTHLCCYMQ